MNTFELDTLLVPIVTNKFIYFLGVEISLALSIFEIKSP